MRKTTLYLFFLATTLFLFSCGNEQKNRQAQAAQQTMPFPVVSIPAKTITTYTTYPARIEGIVNSEVRAKVTGYITDVLIDEGQKVKKGQTLFRLETESLSQDARAAKANVNAAQVEVEKLRPLVEKSIISEVQLETAKAKLEQAKSNYNSIAANIGYATIKSPVNGYAGAIRLRKGALVSPASPTPLTTVSDISKVYAYFSMNEKEYLDFIQKTEGATVEEKIKNLPKVKLILANGSEYGEAGTIETINSQVNDNTGTVSFRAVFNNPSRLLSNGNSGKIQIPTTYEEAIVIPQEATYEQQGTVFVYKVSADNKAVSQPVEVKARVENLYVLGSGLNAGDRIVAKGAGKLRSDTPITPQEVAFDSITQPLEKVFR